MSNETEKKIGKTAQDLVLENTELYKKIDDLRERIDKYAPVHDECEKSKLQCKSYEHKFKQIAEFCYYIADLCAISYKPVE